MNKELLVKEVSFKTSRSGGAGGQHVNKVESRVSLFWDLNKSDAFDRTEKAQLIHSLSHRLNKEGILQLDVSTDRSQFKNKELALSRFFELLSEALKTRKKRVATKIPRTHVLNRLDRKKKQALKKQWRGKPNPFQ
ncbi:alternative ribosome rescue aminoacyl-tRNA hydrolase ArfB [Sphingobacterium suaedae]|uniref:Alternative ribosome rescue aminoacyl-tRNA hydrolase ArfB n=1 Tax=Sphingobacterium suaedae TaxID=1686402 RepID=A0ABW5KHB8_9SPHI